MPSAKRQALELLYRCFREQHLDRGSDRGDAFMAYQGDGGETLWRQSVFEALAEHQRREVPQATGWPDWPAAYRDPGSPEVAAFAAEHRDQVELFQYLHWQADQQLAQAGRRSWELGLGVGICAELPLGPEAGGAEVWASPGVYALGARIGTPPDAINPGGRVWPIAPPVPAALREAGYAPWVAVLRRNMQAAGALRIDRIAALRALLWVPEGGTSADGAWVRYPFRDLLGVLALESQRNRCLVIGEDLVIEQALLHHLQALNELPEDALVPPRLVITAESGERLLERLATREGPNRATRELFAEDSEPERDGTS
jgi:(1->4)-alpha-D-glucan 1-alpha-D-glucosylmutase